MSRYAHETVQLIQQETPDIISPDLCPPNSLDFNPVDYRILGLMQECVYCKGVRCPPIFSLSKLINVGWLVRKCVDIYIYTL